MNRLSTLPADINDYPVPVIELQLTCKAGYVSKHAANPIGIVVAYVRQRFDMTSWNRQHVNGSLRRDIVKRYEFVRFTHDLCRNVAGCYLAKYAIMFRGHVHHLLLIIPDIGSRIQHDHRYPGEYEGGYTDDSECYFFFRTEEKPAQQNSHERLRRHENTRCRNLRVKNSSKVG